MTRRDLCTACREPLAEPRLTVHDASGRLTGQFHTKDCLESLALLVETERTAHKFVGAAR